MPLPINPMFSVQVTNIDEAFAFLDMVASNAQIVKNILAEYQLLANSAKLERTKDEEVKQALASRFNDQVSLYFKSNSPRWRYKSDSGHFEAYIMKQSYYAVIDLDRNMPISKDKVPEDVLQVFDEEIGHYFKTPADYLRSKPPVEVKPGEK